MRKFVLSLLPATGVLLTSVFVTIWNIHGAKTALEIIALWWSEARQPLSVLGLSQALYYIFQAALWYRYREFSKVNHGLPFVSVIVPAYNEGAMVKKSILSAINADYPPDRLEIIVVDDGSRDDTFEHVTSVSMDFPNGIRVIRFATNQGKRAALNAGFRKAVGEIIVTLDSDSEITPSTLRHIVAPFQHDEKIGAVAGRVSVLSRHTLLSRMLNVHYALSFDFGRASQSAYRTVSCCPGALSAFRREIILPELDGWMNQSFLGKPVAHGEDQALTNIVLRKGYDVVYQRSAVVRTIAPTHYKQLCRMFTRWDRSYIVEGFTFAKFMFTDYRSNNRLLPILAFFIGHLRLVMCYVGLLGLIYTTIRNPASFLAYACAFFIASTFAAMYYLWTERGPTFLYGVLYAVYSLLLLQWIFPWALLTVRDERWGTR